MNAASRYLLVTMIVALCACQSSPRKTTGAAAEVDLGAVLKQAEEAYAAGDWRRAQPHYEALAGAFPQDAKNWFRLGNIYARTDRPDPAIAAYREAAIRDPSSSKIWFNMGLVQLRQSANSFLKMELHGDETAPLAAQGSQAYALIMQILGDEESGPAARATDSHRPRLPSPGSIAPAAKVDPGVDVARPAEDPPASGSGPDADTGKARDDPGVDAMAATLEAAVENVAGATVPVTAAIGEQVETPATGAAGAPALDTVERATTSPASIHGSTPELPRDPDDTAESDDGPVAN